MNNEEIKAAMLAEMQAEAKKEDTQTETKEEEQVLQAAEVPPAETKAEQVEEPIVEQPQTEQPIIEQPPTEKPTEEMPKEVPVTIEQPEIPEEVMATAEQPETPKEQPEKQSEETTRETAGEKTFKEVKEVFNVQQLKDTLDSALHESTVRRVKVINREGRVVLDVPLWLATAGGVGAFIGSAGLAILGLVAGIAMGVTVEVERVEEKN